VIVLATGLLSVVAMLGYMLTGHSVRHAEEDARDFFDEHGHWPDQTRQQAAAELGAAQAWAAAARTSTADRDGAV